MASASSKGLRVLCKIRVTVIVVVRLVVAGIVSEGVLLLLFLLHLLLLLGDVSILYSRHMYLFGRDIKYLAFLYHIVVIRIVDGVLYNVILVCINENNCLTSDTDTSNTLF